MFAMTRDNPGSYRDMINALCEIDGVSQFEETIYNTVEEATKHHRQRELYIPHDEYRLVIAGLVRQIKGGQWVFEYDGKHYSLDHHFGNITHRRYRDIKELSTQPQPSGKYKHCEGGGWYSWANLYRINDKFYTDAY
jgi:hypothetical protein